jgi:hypothetical protein
VTINASDHARLLARGAGNVMIHLDAHTPLNQAFPP